MTIKLALAQMEVLPGNPETNIKTMLSMIEEAKKQNANLIIFPEMCVSGYLLSDKWLDENFCLDLMNYNKILLEASDGIAIAYGNIFIDTEINKRIRDNKPHPNKDGRKRKYNAIYVVQNKKLVKRLNETNILPQGVQPKTLLPNYRFFDDERYFFSLQDITKDFNTDLEKLLFPFLIEVEGKEIPIGFELCEDLWCADYRKDGEALNPTKILIKNGAKYIANLSASPWTFGKNVARDKRIEFLKQESGKDFVPFFYVNCTGAQNNGKNIVTFDGGSTAYNKEGLPIMFSKQPYEQELIVIRESELNGKELERKERTKIAQKYEAIIKGIQHLRDSEGYKTQPKYIVGISGGIDSAVVTALLTKAVGADNVMGINMPSKYNSEKTKNSAAYIAEKLGINYGIVPIEEITKLNQEILENADIKGDGKKLSAFNLENVQAKIRGTSILSNLTAKYNALFTNNGNKVEIALGYATLYGDWGGAISPLGDLTKTEVVELAKYLNSEIFKKEIIPNELIPDELWKFKSDQIEPSAELKENQVDPMKFGYHCALLEAMTDFKKKTTEDIMEWYLNRTLAKNLGISQKLIERWGIDDPKEFIEDLEWFSKTIQKSIFKRIQAPPIIITSKSAYGYDIRESILPYYATTKHEELKKHILTNIKKYGQECAK